jgi:RING-box protein 1
MNLQKKPQHNNKDADLPVSNESTATLTAMDIRTNTTPPTTISQVHWIEPIALWEWDLRFIPSEVAQDDVVNDPFQQCTDVLLGTCNHIFHRFCIENWIRTRNVCPLCNTTWSIREAKQYRDT